MRPGRAPTADAPKARAAPRRRRWSHGAPDSWSQHPPASPPFVAALTVLFWAVWIYLVLPLVTVLLWIFGIEVFLHEMVESGYRDLTTALASYALILAGLVGALLLWIWWNVARYSGEGDRRTHKLREVDDLELSRGYRLDQSLVGDLHTQKIVRLEIDKTGCVLLREPGATAA